MRFTTGLPGAVLLLLAAGGFSQDPETRSFRTPSSPPRAHYRVACKIDPDAGTMEGSETIRFRNDDSKALARLAIDWGVSGKRRDYQITVGGKPAKVVHDADPLVFDLPEALQPGAALKLEIRFKLKGWPVLRGDKVLSSVFLPTLWWGVSTHDDYDVNLEVPASYAVATSGRPDPKTGRYRAKGVRAFGVYLGKGHQVKEATAGDTLIRCVFRPAGAECAKLLLATAKEAVDYYRKRFGLYPQPILNIVPGANRPMGGYPAATAQVVVHGQERFEDRDKLHWRWITAHEIGHQYWGEHILEKDSPGWLWIGMGIYADREFSRDSGLGLAKHRELVKRYVEGQRRGFDTTLAITSEQHRRVSFDFNNVCIHGKGFSVISALACVLGRETFDRIYGRCLRELTGRRVGAQEFQGLCEEESGEDLDWFFDQWVRSNRYLRYDVTTRESRREGATHVSVVHVQRSGTLRMPVPVVASFQDGTQQRRFTDRLLDKSTMIFRSKSALRNVAIDPDGDLAMVPPEPIKLSLEDRIQRLPWIGGGGNAYHVYKELQQSNHAELSPWLWTRLGLVLYDGAHYPEALRMFEQASSSAQGKKNGLYEFTALTWQGHVLDMLERRGEAIARYKAALDKSEGNSMQHSQYGLKLDRSWLEKRLKSRFRRY